MRIGSIALLVFSMRAILYLSPTWISSIFPLGLSVGIPGEPGGEDRHLHLGTSALVPVDAHMNLAAIEIDVGHIAIRAVQHILLLARPGRDIPG